MAVFSSTGEASLAGPSPPISPQLTPISVADSPVSATALMFRLMRIGSRLGHPFLLITLWWAVAIVGFGVAISDIYGKNVEHNLQDMLRAELYHVIDSVTIGDHGALSGNPHLADPRFLQPKTGWYWLVEPRGAYTAAPLVSPSLGASDLPIVSVREIPFDKNYERYYFVTDAFGKRVQVAETEVVLDPDGRLARFRVAGNMVVVEDNVRKFICSLYLALIAFGVGTLVVYGFARQNRSSAI